MMRVTMAQPRGGEAAMNAGLEALRVLARAGETPFSPESLEAFLGGWDGHTPVSHSEAYRAAYAPAYRVVREDLGTLVPAVVRTERNLAAGRPRAGGAGRALRVGQEHAGGCAGRCTIRSPSAWMTSFCLRRCARSSGSRSRGATCITSASREEVLAGLMRGGDAPTGAGDCQSGAWLPCAHRAGPVTLIEGSYSHHPFFCGGV